jgi:hypothetical protein
LHLDAPSRLVREVLVRRADTDRCELGNEIGIQTLHDRCAVRSTYLKNMAVVGETYFTFPRPTSNLKDETKLRARSFKWFGIVRFWSVPRNIVLLSRRNMMRDSSESHAWRQTLALLTKISSACEVDRDLTVKSEGEMTPTAACSPCKQKKQERSWMRGRSPANYDQSILASALSKWESDWTILRVKCND